MDKHSLDNLAWLHDWYRVQCNGTWEHTQGLHLSSLFKPGAGANSLDQPAGWKLFIELPHAPPRAYRHPRTFVMDSVDGRWLRCSITSQRFTGESDPESLEQIIGAFRRWMEEPPEPAIPRFEPEVALRP